MQYAWFIWSAILLILWLLVYCSLGSKESRREMLTVSLWTSLLGVTEPLFVPAYWNPPSLFNLAQTTGFDIESFLFAFGVGGGAAVLYESLFRVRHAPVSTAARSHRRHRFHAYALLAGPITFAILALTTPLNPIYIVTIALYAGGIAALLCRPDLYRKMLLGGFVFFCAYFIFFLTLVWSYPAYVATVWNLRAITGILILGVPLEELVFAFGFGLMWSGVYEHAKWYRLNERAHGLPHGLTVVPAHGRIRSPRKGKNR